MVNNGSIHYDHDRDGTHTMIGGCEVKFRNAQHDTFIAIRYENDVLTGKEIRESVYRISVFPEKFMRLSYTLTA